MKVWTGTYTIKGGWSDDLPTLESKNMLILIFGAPLFAEHLDPFETLKKQFPEAHLLGCSSSGEIYQNEVLDDCLTVAVIQFETTHIKTTHHAIANSSESEKIGQAIIKELQSDDLKAVIVLSEGLNVNGSNLVRGLNHQLGQGVSLSGGLAGDGDKFTKTWTLKNGLPTKNCITAVGLYGDAIEMGYGSQGGWDPFGLERTITKSTDNVVFEIDDKPALDLYKEYLGDRAKELPASALLFPLAISPLGSDHKIVRTILAIDEKEKSLTFAGNVPQGWGAQLMTANLDRLIDGAILAGQNASLNHLGPQSSILSIAISCVGRRLVLGERAEEEVEGVLSMMNNANQIGFYSYGEISHLLPLHQCDLHNQTMTVTTLYEKTK